jgi:hypothetical protein
MTLRESDLNQSCEIARPCGTARSQAQAEANKWTGQNMESKSYIRMNLI